MKKTVGIISVIVALLVTAPFALAQSTVNQGAPATPGGGWPTIPDSCARKLPDGGSPYTTIVYNSIDGGVFDIPAVSAPRRRYLVACTSPESSQSCTTKYRQDGINPIMGITNPGDVVPMNGCIVYGAPAKGSDGGTVPIKGTASYLDGGCASTVFECI